MIAEARLKHLLTSYLLKAHVKASHVVKAKAKGQGIHSAHHEVIVRMWMCVTTREEPKSETSNSIHHNTHGAECNHLWESDILFPSP